MSFCTIYGTSLPMMPPNTKLSAKELNNAQYGEIFNRITNIALSRFKWNGLPDSCRPEILEETLFFYGSALFFEDPVLGFLHTPADYPGPYNVYWESIRRQARSFDYDKWYTIDDSVIIKANHTMFPDFLTVANYAPKIANCMRAIDVHTETLKRPYLITGPEKAKLSVQKALEKIGDNEIAVVGQKFGEEVEIKVHNLGTQSNLTDMWANVKNYLNQVYSSLGVKNSYTEKRERMITTEAEGEGNAIRHSLESELEERQIACKRINKMFGLNVSVEANELETFMEELMEAEAARVSGFIGNETQKGDNEDVLESS